MPYTSWIIKGLNGIFIQLNSIFLTVHIFWQQPIDNSINNGTFLNAFLFTSCIWMNIWENENDIVNLHWAFVNAVTSGVLEMFKITYVVKNIIHVLIFLIEPLIEKWHVIKTTVVFFRVRNQQIFSSKGSTQLKSRKYPVFSAETFENMIGTLQNLFTLYFIHGEKTGFSDTVIPCYYKLILAQVTRQWFKNL